MNRTLVAISIFAIVALGIGHWDANAANIRVGEGEEFTTIQDAVNAASPHDRILVGPGDYAGFYVGAPGWEGAPPATVGPVAVIGSGPSTRIDSAGATGDGVGLYPGASGSSVRDLAIEDVGWAVFGVGVDDVTVRNLEITNAFHAIDNRYGDGWRITHNTITGESFGGGHWDIILLGGSGNDNLIAFNDIYTVGTRQLCPPEECTDDYEELYVGVTLVAWAGEFNGRPNTMENNVIVGNLVEVDVDFAPGGLGLLLSVGFGAFDYVGLGGGEPLIRNNRIVHNDFSRSGQSADPPTPIDLRPASLADLNLFRDNAGIGDHPIGNPGVLPPD